MKNLLIFLLAFALWSCSSESPDSDFPERPVPARLVNDLANVIGDSVEVSLEDSLKAFANNYGPQIVVITVPSLNGYDKAQYAYEIGHRWGVGQKEVNNGVVMLVKPKTDDDAGRAFIATGYGLEGNLPDIICGDIVNDIMIPYFKDNDYEGGIAAGVSAVEYAAIGRDYRESMPAALVGNDQNSVAESDMLDDLDFETVVGIILLLAFSLFALFVAYWLVGFVCSLLYRLIFGSDKSSGNDSSDSSSDSFWGSFSSSSDDFDFGGGDFGGGGGGGDW